MIPEQIKEETSNSKRQVITILNTVLCGFMVLGSMALITASVMANDSGRMNMTIWSAMIILSIALPFVCIISIIAFWICYVKKAYKTWLVFSLLPWFNLLLVIVLTVILFS